MGQTPDGTPRRDLFVRHCPWSEPMSDPRIIRWLRAYRLGKEFPAAPQPGLNDPRVQQALLTIAQEHDDMTAEALQRPSR